MELGERAELGLGTGPRFFRSLVVLSSQQNSFSFNHHLSVKPCKVVGDWGQGAGAEPDD